ncbi:MAG: UDP binding domain-containing protein, partial [Rhodoglobus sp.]
LTFKENVPDLRNSKIPDIVAELRQYGLTAQVHDPLGDPEEALHEYGLTLAPLTDLVDLDVLILAVSHQAYLDDPADLLRRVKDGGVVIDVKSVLDPRTMERGLRYWSL